MKKFIFLVITVSAMFFLVNCKQNNKKTVSVSEKTLLLKKADSLFSVGKTYSDDSLNQKKALNFYFRALKLFRQAENSEKTAKVLQYIGYAYDYDEKYDSVIFYHKKALKINTETDNKRMAAISANNLGIAYTISGNSDSALTYYNLGLKLTEITEDTAEFIELYQNMGITYSYEGNYEKAAEYTVKALKYSEKINYINSFVNLNLHIAQYYNYIGDTVKATYYCNRAAEKIDKVKDACTKAGFYNTLGESETEKGNFDKAEAYFFKTLKISEKAKYKRGIAAAYSNLALLSMKNKKYDKAEKYAFMSLNSEKEVDNTAGIISSLITVSNILNLKGNKKDAVNKLKQAENLCLNKKYFENLPDIYFHNYTIYKSLNDYNKALSYFEKYQNLKDSLTGIELKQKIEEIQTKYETEKKQHKIELLNKDNINKQKRIVIQLLLIAILVLLIIFTVFSFFQYKKRKDLKIEKMQQDIFEYLTQIDNINKRVSLISEKSKSEILNKIKEYDLTEREKDVLLLIADGLSNKEIAEKLFISLSTVKTHTSNIFYKLDVKNRIEAVKKTKIL